MSAATAGELLAERDRVRRQAYAETLRRIARLTEAGVLPLPIGSLSLSFWFYEDREGRERAAVAAEALGVTWQADSASNADRYLRAVARIPAASVDLSMYLDRGEVEAPRVTPPGIAFAAELNAAATGEAPVRDDDYSPEGIDRDTEGKQ